MLQSKDQPPNAKTGVCLACSCFEHTSKKQLRLEGGKSQREEILLPEMEQCAFLPAYPRDDSLCHA